ncbi:hypothetical protein TPCG7_11990 [Cutibacterium granulosum]|nr:hypothetical protein TPCG7_11990 [Cutibacterium granulosum]
MDHGVESVHGGHRLGDRLCVGEVGYEGFGVVQLPHDRVDGVGVRPSDEDVMVLAEFLGNGVADPAGATGDED